jgi:hypothetical protein
MAMAAPTRLPAEAKGAATFELVVVAADFVADPVVEGAEELVGAVVVEPESVELGAEEESVAVEDESEDPVVEESEESVVLLEAELPDAVAELSDAVADPVCEEELSLHTTVSGVVTPAEEQICWANETALSWSDWLQAPAKQHAMPLRKSAFLQMHPMSSCWQPPMAVPVVNLVTQPVYFSTDARSA